MTELKLKRLAYRTFRQVRTAYEDSISERAGIIRATEIIERALRKAAADRTIAEAEARQDRAGKEKA